MDKPFEDYYTFKENDLKIKLEDMNTGRKINEDEFVFDDSNRNYKIEKVRSRSENNLEIEEKKKKQFDRLNRIKQKENNKNLSMNHAITPSMFNANPDKKYFENGNINIIIRKIYKSK